jgi:hypothetical protein
LFLIWNIRPALPAWLGRVKDIESPKGVEEGLRVRMSESFNRESSLFVSGGKKALGFDSRGASHSRGGNGLAQSADLKTA